MYVQSSFLISIIIIMEDLAQIRKLFIAAENNS